MITESYYWKQPLLRMASRLTRLSGSEEWTDSQFAQFERDFMIGFFIIRKLLEAPAKVSEELRREPVKLSMLKKIAGAEVVDIYNRSDFWELYDVENPEEVERDLWIVASRVVHTFIYMPTLLREDGPDGIIFTSDWDKEKYVYFISSEEVARVFRLVGRDYPSHLRMERDPNTGEMKVAYVGNHPPD